MLPSQGLVAGIRSKAICKLSTYLGGMFSRKSSKRVLWQLCECRASFVRCWDASCPGMFLHGFPRCCQMTRALWLCVCIIFHSEKGGIVLSVNVTSPSLADAGNLGVFYRCFDPLLASAGKTLVCLSLSVVLVIVSLDKAIDRIDLCL